MSVTTGPKKGLMISAADGDSCGTQFRAMLRALDTFLFAYVIDHTLTTPPGSPSNGAAYIVAATGSGAWAGHNNSIAVWSTDNPSAPSGEWEFYAPENGWTCFTRNGSSLLYWSGSAWVSVAGAVSSVAGRTGAITLAESDITSLVSDLALLAPKASPALTGTPTAPTASALDNTTKIATTAYADAAVGVEKTRALAAQAFDVAVFAPGAGTNSQVLARIPIARTVLFPAGASGSYAKASANATGSTTYTLKKNGSSFATVNFAASASSGTWTQASDANFSAGDVLEIDGPATADATLANVGITLAGLRS
jgi:hypothetical protein